MDGRNRKKWLVAGWAAALAAILLLGLFLGGLVLRGEPEITASRRRAGVTYLIPDSRQEIVREGTPLGTGTRYLITPDKLEQDTSLMFFAEHQYVNVYLDGELIYQMTSAPAGSSVRTPGCDWVSVPVYREDAGREFVVELIPVYEQVRELRTDFLLGSPYALLYNLLSREFIQILLSGMLTMLGAAILIIYIYLLYRRKNEMRLLSLAIAAMCTGLWRLLCTRFMILLLPANPVFLYYFSTSMMIISIIPLFCSLKNGENGLVDRCFRVYVAAATLIFTGQLLMELFGQRELRQMMFITYGVMLVGGLIVVWSSVSALFGQKSGAGIRHENILPLVLAVAVCGDQVRYCIRGFSGGLVLTMGVFVVHILMTGIDFIRDYGEKEKVLVETEIQLNQSRISVMMNQIRSHFIFNILNAISGMCKYDPEKADRTVVCFARYLRTNIDIMQEDAPVTFHAALRHLEDYVVLEQIRFGDQIQFRTDIQVDHFMLPPMLLQPLVENSIRHGLNPKPEGGTILLRTREDGDWIRVEIQDDGVGFDSDGPAADQSVGLRNVRFRLEHMVSGQLEIRSRPGQGTTATILIPKKEAQVCG